MASLEYDIALVPDDRLVAAAYHVSQLFTKHDPHFVLNPNNGPYPHVSLYMAKLMRGDLPDVLNRLERFTKNQSPIHLEAETHKASGGYVGVKYPSTEEIVLAQAHVVNVVSPFRDGEREGDQRRFLETSGVGLKNLQQYGYIKIGPLFSPHMNFSRLKNAETPISDVKLPHHSKFSGHFNRLGLFQLGANGTCVNLVESFPLLGKN